MLYQKDSRRGWAVVAAAFVGMLFSVGVLVVYSFGVISSAILADFGWNEVQRSTIFVAFSFTATLAGPIWGMIADRIGSRRVILVSMSMLSLCFCLLAAIPGDLVIASLAFAATGVFGGGTLPPAFAKTIVGWFEKHLGLALGIAMLGVGMGAAVLPVVAAAITSGFGWRITCLVYAGLVMFISLPIAVTLLREFPDGPRYGRLQDDATHSPDQREASLSSAMRLPRTWVLLLFAFFSGAVLLSCVTNFVPLLQSRGETLMSAARYQSILGISLILGRIITGVLLDRLFAPWVMAGILLLATIGISFLQAGHLGLAYALAAAGIGLAIGGEVDFLAFMVSKYFRRANFTTIYALMFAAYSFGASFGPLVFGWLVQRSGGYDFGLMLCALVIFLVGLSMFALPRYGKA